MRERYAFVMMIKEKWWREFLRLHSKGREIQSYVRRGLAPPKNASLVFFYVAKPVCEIAGYAEFIERKVGKPEDLWKEYGGESVLESAEEYFQFVKGNTPVSFIRFKNLKEAANPIPLRNALMFLGVKRLGRYGFYIDREMAEKFLAIME
jgi:predicted transcriptional regulator